MSRVVIARGPKVPCRCPCSAFAVRFLILSEEFQGNTRTSACYRSTLQFHNNFRVDFLLCSCLRLAALGPRMLSRRKHTTRDARRPTAHSWGKAMLRCACVEPVSGVGPRTSGSR